jgi:hypothetical protein
MMSLRFSGMVSPWTGLLLAVVCAVLCWRYYKRDVRELRNRLRWLLPLLRCLALVMILLILCGPILAFVYSLGGVSTENLFAAVWLLLWECLLIASVGLLCSAWYSTTVAAFVAAYVLSGFLVFLTMLMRVPLPVPSRQWMDRSMVGRPWASGFLQDLLDNLNVGPLATVVLETVPVMLVVAFLLFLTRMLLFRRAFVGHSSLMLRVFRRLDSFFQRLNDRTGGVMIVADRESFPEYDPVAWREREKKSLGRARYLFRVLLLIELPK